MGASILVHWPGASEDEEGGHPGFFNDDQAWACWLAKVVDDRPCLSVVADLGLEALLSHTTEGADPDEIEWTTPDDLERAADALRKLVEDKDPRVRPLVELYEDDANGIEPPEVEFARDLGDVAQIAQYARGTGASSVTLGYYW